MSTTTIAKLRRVEEGGRSAAEDAVTYAVAHRIRVDILCILNEGTYCADELAELIDLPGSTVRHHIDELVKSGSIEIARIDKARNFDQKFYRAVEIPYFTDEEMAAMTPEMRHEVYGLILQASTVEAMAAFRARKITNDPRANLSWSWFNVDAEGREEIADLLAESWERARKIEALSTDRRIESGEDPVSIIITFFGYERFRPADARVPRSA